MISGFKRQAHVAGPCLIVLLTAFWAVFLIPGHFLAASTGPQTTATEDTPDNAQELCKVIIDKIYQAYGGRERISEIKDSTSLAYNRVLPQGLNIRTVSYMKMPNKIRIDMEGMEIMAFDGKLGWMMHPARGLVQRMPQNVLEDFKRSSWVAQGMLNPEIMNIPPKLEGRAPIDGKDYIVISYADCGEFDSVYMYVDPDTFLPHLFAYIKPGVKIQSIHSDYRDMDGLKVPFSIQMDFDGKKFIALSMIEFKFNANLDDSLFSAESLKSKKGSQSLVDLTEAIDNVPEPELIHKVKPVYPNLARPARVSGKVVLQITIDKEGLVRDVRIIQGHVMLKDAAVTAVKQWKYSPTIKDGQPVPVNTTVTINF